MRQAFRALGAALLALALGTCGLGAAMAQEPLSGTDLTALAYKSLIYIATTYYDHDSDQLKQSEVGTGFVITEDGLVLTAYHVVKDWDVQADEDKSAYPLKIKLGSRHGDEVDAEIVGRDAQYDLALLRILKLDRKYAAANVCFAPGLVDGEAVTAFGFPDDVERSGTAGTYDNASGDNGRWSVSIRNAGGLSGGPLYDRFGDVVGVVRSVVGSTAVTSFITPARRAKALIDAQTDFTPECLRNGGGPPPPPPSSEEPPSSVEPVDDGSDWYGGSLWQDGTAYCRSVKDVIAATTHLDRLHYADTGKPVGELDTATIKEQLLLTLDSANEPFCSIAVPIQPGDGDPSVIDCTLDVSASLPKFKEVFASGASDLGKCLGPLGWHSATRQLDCKPSPGGDINCYSSWKKNGEETRFYGFSSGTPSVYGLGVYFSIPAN